MEPKSTGGKPKGIISRQMFISASDIPIKEK
jgi:calcium-dependent protein kinase